MGASRDKTGHIHESYSNVPKERWDSIFKKHKCYNCDNRGTIPYRISKNTIWICPECEPTLKRNIKMGLYE
jgi:ribosomal protein L37AE/L43A